MDVLVYDKSFNGLLTAFFEVYEYKFKNPVIFKQDEAFGSLFGTHHTVHTIRFVSLQQLAEIAAYSTHLQWLSSLPAVVHSAIAILSGKGRNAVVLRD